MYQVGNTLYVGADTGNFTPVTALGGFLHAVKPEDGKATWTYDSTAPVVGVVSANNGSRIIVTSTDGYLHAIRSSDGKQLWRVKASEPANPQQFFPHTLFTSVGPPVLSSDGKSVLLLGADGLHAFSTVTGKTQWIEKAAVAGGNLCPISNRPLLGKSGDVELIYSLANDSHKPRPYPAGSDPDMLAIHANGAGASWRSHPGFEGPCPSMWQVSDDGASMFATVELGNFYLHALHTSNGENKWEFQCPQLEPFVTIV